MTDADKISQKEIELRRTAIKVTLFETFSFIEKQKIANRATIISDIPTINGLEMEYAKAKRVYSFSTGQILSCGPNDAPANYQSSGYGLLKPFLLKDLNNTYSVKDGAGKANIEMGKGFSTEGELWGLETLDDSTNGYFRAVYPIDGFTRVPVNYMIGHHFLIDENSLRGHGYIQIKIGSLNIGFYDYDHGKQRYIFIDCKDRVSLGEFEKILDAITYSFALISGSLVRDEVTILGFGNSDFTSLQGFRFNQLKDSNISDLELVNPRQHRDYDGLDRMIFFPEEVFLKIIHLCLTDKRWLRAIKIISQARGLPTELEASAFFVSLETIKEIIIEENNDKIAPFKNPKTATDYIEKFKTIIEEIADDEFTNKNAVIRKLNDLNKVGNNESFKLAFGLVGFELTKADIQCISLRNRFLHGNIPFEHEPEQKKERELIKIALNAHLLTCSLILKYANYNGVVKDFLKYWDLHTKTENQDELFRPI